MKASIAGRMLRKLDSLSIAGEEFVCVGYLARKVGTVAELQAVLISGERNEKTSPRVAKIAGKWQEALSEYPNGSQEEVLVPAGDIKTLAASALTQTQDKAKRGVSK